MYLQEKVILFKAHFLGLALVFFNVSLTTHSSM